MFVAWIKQTSCLYKGPPGETLGKKVVFFHFVNGFCMFLFTFVVQFLFFVHSFVVQFWVGFLFRFLSFISKKYHTMTTEPFFSATRSQDLDETKIKVGLIPSW